MKTSKLLQALRISGISLGIIISVYGCSSSKDGQQGEDKDNLDNSGDENAAAAGDENANAGEEGAAGNNLTGDNAGSSPEGANVGMEESGSNAPTNAVPEANPAPMNQLPEAAPAAATATTATAAAAPTGDGSRVVRFITANGTAVHGKADAASSQIASLNQGDSVVVSIMGGWGMIADGRYVQIDKLSERAVPRAKTANHWN